MENRISVAHMKKIFFDDDDLAVEKVSLSLVDDLTVGDAVTFFSTRIKISHFVSSAYALDGPLVHAPSGTTISMPRPVKCVQIIQNTKNAKNGRPTSSPGKREATLHHHSTIEKRYGQRLNSPETKKIEYSKKKQ